MRERLLAQRMSLSVCPFCRPFGPFGPIFDADGVDNEQDRDQIQDSDQLAFSAIRSAVDMDAYFAG